MYESELLRRVRNRTVKPGQLSTGRNNAAEARSGRNLAAVPALFGLAASSSVAARKTVREWPIRPPQGPLHSSPVVKRPRNRLGWRPAIAPHQTAAILDRPAMCGRRYGCRPGRRAFQNHVPVPGRAAKPFGPPFQIGRSGPLPAPACTSATPISGPQRCNARRSPCSTDPPQPASATRCFGSGPVQGTAAEGRVCHLHKDENVTFRPLTPERIRSLTRYPYLEQVKV